MPFYHPAKFPLCITVTLWFRSKNKNVWYKSLIDYKIDYFFNKIVKRRSRFDLESFFTVSNNNIILYPIIYVSFVESHIGLSNGTITGRKLVYFVLSKIPKPVEGTKQVWFIRYEKRSNTVYKCHGRVRSNIIPMAKY